MAMSDMASSAASNSDFSVRDLNRSLAKVLAACDRLGVVRISSRKGRTYELRAQPVVDRDGRERPFPDFAARLKAIGMPPMTKRQSENFDRLIAGE
jgi:hypothetical protein